MIRLRIWDRGDHYIVAKMLMEGVPDGPSWKIAIPKYCEWVRLCPKLTPFQIRINEKFKEYEPGSSR